MIRSKKVPSSISILSTKEPKPNHIPIPLISRNDWYSSHTHTFTYSLSLSLSSSGALLLLLSVSFPLSLYSLAYWTDFLLAWVYVICVICDGQIQAEELFLYGRSVNALKVDPSFPIFPLMHVFFCSFSYPPYIR